MTLILGNHGKQAVVITANPTPFVSKITPAAVVASSSTRITVYGNDFDSKSIKLIFTCKVPGTSGTKTYDFSSSVMQPVGANVFMVSQTQIISNRNGAKSGFRTPTAVHDLS